MGANVKFVRYQHPQAGLTPGPLAGLMRCSQCGSLCDYEIQTDKWNPGYLALIDKPIGKLQLSDDGGRTWRHATLQEEETFVAETFSRAQRKETA